MLEEYNDSFLWIFLRVCATLLSPLNTRNWKTCRTGVSITATSSLRFMPELITISKGISKLPFYFGSKFSKTSAYLDLLLSATDDGVVEKTYQELASRWKWHRNTVVKFLEDLRGDGIVSEVANGRTIISSEQMSTISEGIQNTFKTDSKLDSGKSKPKIKEVSSTPQNTFKTDSKNVKETEHADAATSSNIYISSKPLTSKPEELVVNPDTTSSLIANPSIASSVQKAAPRTAKQSKEKVKKPSREEGLEGRLEAEEKKLRKTEEGENSPMMPIGIHLICTKRRFPNYGALKQHLHANVRAARLLRFYTPKQIATACVAAMAESKNLGGFEVHLSTVQKKMGLSDRVSDDPKINEFIAAVVARYEIEKSTLLTRNSTLIASAPTQVQTAPTA